MPKQIQVDNQIIEFPDDMPDNEIEAVIKKEFYSQPQPQQPIKPAQPFGMGAELVKKASEYIPQQGRVGAFSTTSSNIPFAPRIKAGISALTAKAATDNYGFLQKRSYNLAKDGQYFAI